MPALLTSLTPSTLKPGATLMLGGTGFEAQAEVWFSSEGISTTVPAVFVSAQELRVTVPDLFRGGAGIVSVAVVNAGEEATAALPLTLEAQPEISDVWPLASVAAVRRVLGVASTETFDDTRLGELIQLASVQLAGACHREFRVVSYVDVLDGDGTPLLLLPHTPVVAVTGLLISGQAIDTSELKVYPQYVKFESGGEYDARLRAGGRIFPTGSRNVQISYQAGFSQVPADISHACILQVIFLMNTLPKQGVVSEGNSTSGLNTTWSDEDLAPAVRRAISRYLPRRVSAI